MQTIQTLVVDDDAEFRRRVRQTLEQNSDLSVIDEAANGKEALEKTRELQPDLLIMDIRMPDINGLDAMDALKTTHPHIQIIILSLYDLDEYKTAAAELGAAGYVTKRQLTRDLIPTIVRLFSPETITQE
jgi:YesN/AraC family two-component response regulator